MTCRIGSSAGEAQPLDQQGGGPLGSNAAELGQSGGAASPAAGPRLTGSGRWGQPPADIAPGSGDDAH
eukprot:8031043-Pyramimonas_sp.AAC.1